MENIDVKDYPLTHIVVFMNGKSKRKIMFNKKLLKRLENGDYEVLEINKDKLPLKHSIPRKDIVTIEALSLYKGSKKDNKYFIS